MSLPNQFKNKKFFASVVSVFLLLVLLLPAFSSAGIVNCDGTAEHQCNFSSFIGMINGIISWIISIAGVIFTISAIYGGFLYMTSGEKPANRAKANGILWNTLLGFVIVLVAWLIVYTLLNVLTAGTVYHDSIFQFIGTGK